MMRGLSISTITAGEGNMQAGEDFSPRRKGRKERLGEGRADGSEMDTTSGFILFGLRGKMGSFGEVVLRPLKGRGSGLRAGMGGVELDGCEHNFRLHFSPVGNEPLEVRRLFSTKNSEMLV